MSSDVIRKAIDDKEVKTYGMIIGNQLGEIQRSSNTLYASATFIENTQSLYENRILNSGELFYDGCS